MPLTMVNPGEENIIKRIGGKEDTRREASLRRENQ